MVAAAAPPPTTASADIGGRLMETLAPRPTERLVLRAADPRTPRRGLHPHPTTADSRSLASVGRVRPTHPCTSTPPPIIFPVLARLRRVAAPAVSALALCPALRLALPGHRSAVSRLCPVRPIVDLGSLALALGFAHLAAAVAAAGAGPGIDPSLPRRLRCRLLLDVDLAPIVFVLGRHSLHALPPAGWGGLPYALGRLFFVPVFVLPLPLRLASVPPAEPPPRRWGAWRVCPS